MSRAGAGRDDVSHPDKVLFPDAGHGTKADLVAYYRRAADRLLPYLRGRAVTLMRFPDGVAAKGFVQKSAADYFPDTIRTASVEKEGGSYEAILVDDADGLAYLAGLAAVELHVALSAVDRIRHADQLILDLDPSDGDFAKVQAVALDLRDWLEAHDLPCLVKTSGSRGLHIHVPLSRDADADFDAARGAARMIAAGVVERCPHLATLEQRKDDRGDRVFVDYLRNAYGQTAVAPYGLRARPTAPVAVPLDWDEALDPATTPTRITIDNVFRRLARKADPWAGFETSRVPLSRVEAAAGG